MLTKSLFLAMFISFITISAFAQTETTYYKKDKRVSTLDSSDYTRITVKNITSASLYDITERYKNGNLKSVGKSTKKDLILWVGPYTKYYSTGKKQEEGIYVAGKLSGSFTEYYPNGVLHSIKEYLSESTPKNGNSMGAINNYHYLYKTCNDSTGTPTLVNGKGHYMGYSEGYDQVYEEGDVKNGERTGHWIGKEKDTVLFNEDYENGKLIKGISTDKQGKVYKYTLRETNPEYLGGEKAFGKFLRDNLIYPKKARENKIQGIAFISFIVERDGSLADIKVVKAPSKALGDEGVWVLGLSPNWRPGTQYGQPVRVQFTVPLNFSLGE